MWDSSQMCRRLRRAYFDSKFFGLRRWRREGLFRNLAASVIYKREYSTHTLPIVKNIHASDNNNNNSKHICIATLGRNFRGNNTLSVV